MRGGRFLLVLTLAILVRGPAARGEDYYSQEKCSLCHIRQSVFFSPGFASPETLKAFGEERVCYSCHNGSVRDSRGVLWRGAQHPSVGADGSGGKKCSSCHSPHAKGGWAVLAGTSIAIRKGGDATCTKCHRGHDRAAGPLHRSGFPDGGCGECHRAHGGTGKSLLREAKGTLCLRCHPDVDSERAGGHPVARAVSSSGGRRALPECLVCHPVHGTAERAGAIDGECAGCHRFGTDNGAKVHPAAERCTECHSFHTKTGEKGRGLRRADIRTDLLCGRCHPRQPAEDRTKSRAKGTHPTRSADGGKDICFRCHRIHKAAPGGALLVSDKQYSCLECHEDQNTISEIAGIVLAHPVFERVEKGRLAAAAAAKHLKLGTAGEIVCRTCHSVHSASPDTALLAKGSAGDGSCVWCHEGMSGRSHVAAGSAVVGPGCGTCHPVHGKRAPAVAGAGVPDPWTMICAACHARASSHGPGTAGGAERRPAEMPGFDGRGRKIRTGSISCPTCHEPHGKTRNTRLRHPYESSGFVCTACHRDKETVALTPHDLRGIAGKSICEPCHRPHGGKAPWMWGLSIDEGEGAAAACRGCHRDKGMAKTLPRGGHPVNVVVGRPLPEQFPLYGSSGEKMRNGVLTCATCHQVHGVGLLQSGRGAGMLLRSEGAMATEDLGRVRACVPCHPGKKAMHGQADCIWCHPPHEQPNVAPDCGACHTMGGKGIAQTHIAKGHGCGACHRLHTAKSGSGPSGGCLGCHPKEERIIGTGHAESDAEPCRTCHPAHESGDERPVKRRRWEEIFAPDIPCLRCHRDDGPGPAIERGDHPKSRKQVPTSYGAVVTLETPIMMQGRLREGGSPLFPFFDETGRKSMSGLLGCLTCHDPHAGIRTGERRAAGGYLRDPSGGFLAEVCSPCHRDSGAERIRKFHELPRKTD